MPQGFELKIVVDTFRFFAEFAKIETLRAFCWLVAVALVQELLFYTVPAGNA